MKGIVCRCKVNDGEVWSITVGNPSEKNENTTYVLVVGLFNYIKVYKYDCVMSFVTDLSSVSVHSMSISHVCMNDSGNLALATSIDAKVSLWDIPNQRNLRVFNTLPFCGNSNRFVSISSLSSQSNILTNSDYIVTNFESKSVSFLKISTDANGDNSIDFNEDVGIVEDAAGDGNFSIAVHSGVSTIETFSGAPSTLAVGYTNGHISLHDLSTKRTLLVDLKCHLNTIKCLKFSPDCRLLAIGAYDGSIKVLNTASLSMVAFLVGHNACVSGLLFSFESPYSELYSSSLDSTIIKWNIDKMAIVDTYVDHKSECWALTSNDKANFIFSADSEGNIYVYNKD